MCGPVVRQSQLFFSSTRRVLRQWRFLPERILEVTKLICQWVRFAEKCDRYLTADARLFKYTWHNAFACSVQAANLHGSLQRCRRWIRFLHVHPHDKKSIFVFECSCTVRTGSTKLKSVCSVRCGSRSFAQLCSLVVRFLVSCSQPR
jgi:hypothetical protein